MKFLVFEVSVQLDEVPVAFELRKIWLKSLQASLHLSLTHHTNLPHDTFLNIKRIDIFLSHLAFFDALDSNLRGGWWCSNLSTTCGQSLQNIPPLK